MPELGWSKSDALVSRGEMGDEEGCEADESLCISGVRKGKILHSG